VGFRRFLHKINMNSKNRFPTVQVWEGLNRSGRHHIGEWSGKADVPMCGDATAALIGGQRVVCGVVGYEVKDGFLGVRVRLLELPRDIHTFAILPRSKGLSHTDFEAFYATHAAFQLLMYGRELAEPTPLKFPKLGVEEELAVLLAAAFYGRNSWRSQLRGSWYDGDYRSKRFHWLCGELQRVRNTYGEEFVDYAANKNQGYIEQTRRALN